MSDGATVAAAGYSNNKNCKWTLSKETSVPSGVYWYDSYTKTMSTGNIGKKIIYYGSEYSVDKIGISAVAYSGQSMNQTFTWTSSNTNVATINANNGGIVGKASGTTTITAIKSINGTNYSLSFELIVIGADQYNAGVRIAKVDGVQYYDYTIPINDVLEETVNLCKVHRCPNYDELVESVWVQVMDPAYYTNQFEANLVESFLWFYKQVKTGAVWDVKCKNRWEEVFPILPFLKNKEGQFEKFIFRGEKITPEDLGNLMYGYNGRATGFGEITLFWGGGVAAQKNMTSDILTDPSRYYGDDENDHVNIEIGYTMFNRDYPDYPAYAFNAIPAGRVLGTLGNLFLKLSQ